MTIEQETRLGHYSLIEEVGRGGMGIVYKAQDLKLNRIVALKVMVGENAQSTSVQRFIREAKTVAKLSHPNIINVLDVGWEGNYYFFAMDFVDGESLEKAIENRKLSYKNALKVFITILETMNFAHENGIIHRDLKPANIMLDSTKKPIVMDFGVALSLDESIQLSRSGTMVGTVGYIAPEQLDGKRNSVDKRSDIYSLGAIMYKTFTGRNAFFGSSAQLLNKIQNQEPIPMCKIKGNLPKDLEYICAKAMSKKKKQRYSSAKEMAADVRLVQSGKRIKRSSGLSIATSIVEKISQTQIYTTRYVALLFIASVSFWLGVFCNSNVDMPHDYDVHVWQSCWNGNELDFTNDIWRGLTTSQQQKYAHSYQKWYAKHMGVPVERIHQRTGITMVFVPPGKFMMGSLKQEKGHQPHELSRSITISVPYYIAKYEVSMKEWGKKTMYPVTAITWQEADHFCIANGLSLPSESHWEYACRAGTTTAFCEGKVLSKPSTSVKMVNVVQEKNAWGVCNMHRNVREWCQNYAPLANKVTVDIDKYTKQVSGAHILRGGSWKTTVDNSRSASRFMELNTQDDIGFRPIISLQYLFRKPQNVFVPTTFVKN